MPIFRGTFFLISVELWVSIFEICAELWVMNYNLIDCPFSFFLFQDFIIGSVDPPLAFLTKKQNKKARDHCIYDGSESELIDINIRVTQGSSLGPLLFLLNIGDLPQAVQNKTPL